MIWGWFFRCIIELLYTGRDAGIFYLSNQYFFSKGVFDTKFIYSMLNFIFLFVKVFVYKILFIRHLYTVKKSFGSTCFFIFPE